MVAGYSPLPTWLRTAARQALDDPDALKEEIDATWFYIERGYDIEPRAYFEKEAPTNGFKFALAQAIHHVWKRDPKVAALEAETAQLRADLSGPPTRKNQARRGSSTHVQNMSGLDKHDEATQSAEPVTTYTAMVWAVMKEEQKYEEYVRVRTLCLDLSAQVSRLTSDLSALKGERERMFPIQGGPAVPLSLMKRFEHQAQRNHDQSIERLAERGGLDANEAFAVLSGLSYWGIKSLKNPEASVRLLNLVRLLDLPNAEIERLKAEVAALKGAQAQTNG